MAANIIYEKLGVFYLGTRFDLASKTRLANPVLYDSSDLVTHAVCVGMTGSGKTGLGISLIEEAAIDGIPVLAIDPKGDLPNFMLPPAADEAAKWRQGLAEWDQRPVVPAGIGEFFLPGDATAYEPVLYGAARVRYVDARRSIDLVRDVQALTPFGGGAVTVDWEQADPTAPSPAALLSAPVRATATYAALPAPAANPKHYAGWTRDFERWVARSRPLTLFAAPALGLSSAPDESEREFLLRVQQSGREARDAAVAALRAKYAPRLARAQEKVRRAQEAIAREQPQAGHQKLQTAVSVGATLLGALMGRKAVSMSTLGRATTAVRGASRSAKEAADVARAETRAGDIEEELQDLQAEMESAVAALTAVTDAPIDTLEITPARGGIDVQLVTLAWRPRT